MNKKSDANLHRGHRKRLKTMFFNTYESNFSDHQLLELLLFHSIPRADTNETAHKLLETFGSIAGVLNAKPEQLMEVEGIGQNSALLLKLIPELMRRMQAENTSRLTKIESLDELGSFFVEKFALETTEVAMLVCVNKNKRVISMHRLKYANNPYGESALDEILSICVNIKPHTVVLAHLHPDGCMKPSSQDQLFTNTLSHSLETLRIILIEHFVVTHDGYTRILDNLDYSYKNNHEKIMSLLK